MPWLLPRFSVPLTGLILALLLTLSAPAQLDTLAEWYREPVQTRPQEINHFLHMAGMTDPSSVATNYQLPTNSVYMQPA